jgi:CspA family cold shock protein
MTERTSGTIKWFNPARRYGFIRREGGQPDVFVHANDLRDAGDAYRLMEGDRVEFAVEQTPKGLRAVGVVRVSQPRRSPPLY